MQGLVFIAHEQFASSIGPSTRQSWPWARRAAASCRGWIYKAGGDATTASPVAPAMPSFFKRSRASAGDDKARQPKLKKSQDEELKSAFSGDEALLQLHEETIELLRRTKTPAAKSPSAFAILRQRATYPSAVSGSAPSKVRMTIEVLDDDDDDEQAQVPVAASDTVAHTAATQQPSPGARPRNGDGQDDPFAFNAEEARVRKASDTFYPDVSPSKKAMDQQLHAFTHEQLRLQTLDRSEQLQDERRRQEVAHHQLNKLPNRLETSAIKVNRYFQIFHLDTRKSRLTVGMSVDPSDVPRVSVSETVPPATDPGPRRQDNSSGPVA